MNHPEHRPTGRRDERLRFLKSAFALAVFLIFVLTACNACRKQRLEGAHEATITVYGFSILQEPMEKEIFPAFSKEWERKTGQKLTFVSSFAGSETVTNQILAGAKADLAVLAIERNAERLLKGEATKTDWREYPHKGIVNRTPMVIMVRNGNPKGIRDFEDLAKPGVRVIHPDPVSSGGAQWSLLALYGSQLVRSEKQTGKRDEAKALDLLKRIWKNVIATPESARQARTQFETGFGDALVTYEVDALQLINRSAAFEIVAPQSTVFSEHPVVIIDSGMTPSKRALVELFIHSLWSERAQRAWVRYNFRSVTDERLNEAQRQFVKIPLPIGIDYFGGWEEAYPAIIDGLWKKQVKTAGS
jgi:sulfate transport system substrate-binding protein